MTGTTSTRTRTWHGALRSSGWPVAFLAFGLMSTNRGQGDPGVVRTTDLQVVNDAGQVVARISSDAHGAGALQLYSASGQDRAMLASFPPPAEGAEPGPGVLHLYYGDGRPSAYVGPNTLGQGGLYVMEPGGEERIGLSCDGEGRSSMKLSSAAGSSVQMASDMPIHGPYVGIDSGSGVIVSMSRSATGGGHLAVMKPDGGYEWKVGEDPPMPAPEAEPPAPEQPEEPRRRRRERRR